MPPARKRPRAYDPAKTRKAVLAQFGHVREAMGVLTQEQLALPTRLGEWTVRDLAAHLTMAVESVNRALDLPEPPKAELNPWTTPPPPLRTPVPSPRAATTWPRPTPTSSPSTRGWSSGSPRGSRPLRATGSSTPAPHGMALDDYLLTRTIELVVHTDDLNDAVPGLDIPYDRHALATCVRLLADTLAARAPGGSTEVRIPPYAVVQCVEGPRHTRGTPPNVVETDPLTWIRLATGRLEWAAALDEAKVGASGERADLSALLPLMS